MRFAVPIADGKLTEHFGHCKEFAFIDVTDNRIIAQENKTPPPHEPGVLPKWLQELGTHVVIAGGIGHRAVQLLDSAGIKVISGAPAVAPEILVSDYLNNTLKAGGNLCSGHEHGEHHSCGH
jgi:predicted Fe-Mo cluster-binding NifX family protein